MTKKHKTPLGIFTEAVGLYFANFRQFAKYMTFPVLGQIAGLILVLGCTYFYSKNMPFLMEKYTFLKDFNTLILLAILITIPGMAIFMKAFWEYLVAYGAVNSMLENMLKSGKVYDFDAHTELIKRRTLPFVGLWLLFGIFTLLGSFPLLWVPAGVLAVYFVLIFQVFTYEPELSPVGCAKKSMLLIKGHFASTFILLTLAGLLTYVAIPQIINNLFDICKITESLSKAIVPVIQALPVDELNTVLSAAGLKQIAVLSVAGFIISTTIAQILIQYTLPMRSILWGLWYKELNGKLPAGQEKKRATKGKRPSEVLMEETHKKYGDSSKKSDKTSSGERKRLDRNILKRAMEKEDEE